MKDIPKTVADKINSSIVEALNNTSIELEAVFHKKISDEKFKYLMKHCRKNGNFKQTQISSTLDISPQQKNIRITIEGNDDITEFCKSKGKTFPENLEIIKKERINNDSKQLNNQQLQQLNDQLKVIFGFKLNMKKETKIHVTDISSILPEGTTTFRLKKRYSFQTSSFRIDMTSVRQHKSESRQFNEHDLSTATSRNEVEIEFLPLNSHCSDDCSELTKDFLNLMHTVSCVFNSATHKNKDEENVIKGYKTLLKADLDKLKQSNKRFPNDERKIDQKEFLSYKPVTLQVSNLDKKCKGVPGNILQNYAVTEKADGDRMLLFIYESKLYLLNDQRKIIFTGIGNEKLEKLNDSLIDGEFIKTGKFKEELNLFLGFDIYFYKNEDKRSLPFMIKGENRYKLLQEALKYIEEVVNTMNTSKFNFQTKIFVHKDDDKDDDIFKAAKEVNNSTKYDYKIDGLIFQPINLGCGQLYMGRNPNNSRSLSTTWNRVYKWKPPLENTIDLMIKLPQTDLEYLPDEVLCELRAYNNENSEEKIELNSIKEILKAGDKYNKFTNKNYIVFAKQNFSKSELDGVKNGDIWEFTYINPQDSDKKPDKTWIDQRNNKQPGQWKKHKKREDKTDILRNKNKNSLIDNFDLAGSANAIKTANNVYSTIVQQPIYQDVIHGIKEPNVEMTSQYYVNTLNRKDRLILNMQNFHNHVKENLIEQFKGKPKEDQKNLVDVACGVGGDIKKYADKYKLVLGFDISFDGIFGYNDSAWVRYLSERHRRKKDNKSTPPMLFLPQNMGKNLAEFEDQNDKITEDEKDFQKISEYINDKIGFNEMKQYKQFDQIVEKLNPFKEAIKDQFDVVSCQFALHYFFKDEATLETFCKNVNILLKKGGHFIGTCFDGSQVNDKFIQSNTSRLEGNIDENVVWRIDKAYDDYEPFGSAIDVFVESIGQSRREYLVNFEHLEKILKDKYNIELETRYSFETLFDNSRIKMQDKALQNYSRMNQCFIFKKNK